MPTLRSTAAWQALTAHHAEMQGLHLRGDLGWSAHAR